MGRYTWIKLYTEILDDPKMGRLPNHLWRRAVELFLLAGRTGTTGQLPSVEEMAWTLRSSEDEVRKGLMSLAEIGVVHEAEPGKWVVVNFVKRQAAMTDAERKRKQRAGVTENPGKNKKAVTTASQSCHDFVTEEEEEEEEEGEEEEKPAAAAENPFRVYEQNIGPLTAAVSEKIKLAETDYPEGWVCEAIRLAALRNKRRWDYAEGILRNWFANGKDSGELPGSDKDYLSSLQRAGYSLEGAAV